MYTMYNCKDKRLIQLVVVVLLIMSSLQSITSDSLCSTIMCISGSECFRVINYLEMGYIHSVKYICVSYQSMLYSMSDDSNGSSNILICIL